MGQPVDVEIEDALIAHAVRFQRVVLVGFLDGGDAIVQHRVLLIARTVASRMRGDCLRVSKQVLQELFVTLTRKVSQPCSNDEALAVLEDLTAWPVMTIDYAAIRAAVRLASQAALSF